MLLRILLALILLAAPALAEEKVVAGLSQDNVSITATFDGTGILVFGAVKREAPAPTHAPLHVVIEVSGPPHAVTVRRKEKVLGIWINRDTIEVDSAPSFYAIAATAPLSEIVSETENLRHKISVDRLIRMVGAPDHISDAENFVEAVIRIRRDNGLYTDTGASVQLTDETLFKTEFDLPSNLVEGDYSARIFLIRGTEVVDSFETAIAVRKVGLERWIYNLAHQRPLIYGLLSLAIAIAAGWLASAVFRVLRLN
ncbi:MAG: TIGR02186 family protein [Rhodobacteraceae bacterium]|nr:TIGR02186 family protein [Paracoccaceae bacterium]